MSADIGRFVGKWELLQERSRYELGTPPREGTYEVSQAGARCVFKMDWVDDAGDIRKMKYAEVCDSEFHDYPVREIADEIRLSLVSKVVLESQAKKGGKIVMSAKRELQSDNLMKVTLSGIGPDGRTYRNVSWYQRMG